MTPESTLVGTGALNLVGDRDQLRARILGASRQYGPHLDTGEPNTAECLRSGDRAGYREDVRRDGGEQPFPAADTSNSKIFAVQNPAPTLASLTPATGSRLQTMDVVFDGTNFVPGITQVNFGATDITVNGVTLPVFR